jgi:hypothetical protein
MEVTDSSFIQSSTGYTSSISYSGRGYVSGKAHSFKAHLTDSAGKNILTAEGQWDKISKTKTGEVFTDATPMKEEVEVADLTSQGDWESRKLWKDVADGIRTGDFDKASREKTKIEVEQRERRKTEAAEGKTWQLKHFKYQEADPECEHTIKHHSPGLTPRTCG